MKTFVFCYLIHELCNDFRPPSHRLVPTRPGSACLWSSSSGTDWSMLLPTVKCSPSLCSAISWLMERSELTRPTQLVSWVCTHEHFLWLVVTLNVMFTLLRFWYIAICCVYQISFPFPRLVRTTGFCMTPRAASAFTLSGMRTQRLG